MKMLEFGGQYVLQNLLKDKFTIVTYKGYYILRTLN